MNEELDTIIEVHEFRTEKDRSVVLTIRAQRGHEPIVQVYIDPLDARRLALTLLAMADLPALPGFKGVHFSPACGALMFERSSVAAVRQERRER